MHAWEKGFCNCLQRTAQVLCNDGSTTLLCMLQTLHDQYACKGKVGISNFPHAASFAPAGTQSLNRKLASQTCALAHHKTVAVGIPWP